MQPSKVHRTPDGEADDKVQGQRQRTPETPLRNTGNRSPIRVETIKDTRSPVRRGSQSGISQSNTNNMNTNTYTLRSAAWIHTPSMVRLAVSEFTFNPAWSIKLLRDGFKLPTKVAKGLASGKISYEVQGESVVFTA